MRAGGARCEDRTAKRGTLTEMIGAHVSLELGSYLGGLGLALVAERILLKHAVGGCADDHPGHVGLRLAMPQQNKGHVRLNWANGEKAQLYILCCVNVKM